MAEVSLTDIVHVTEVTENIRITEVTENIDAKITEEIIHVSNATDHVNVSSTQETIDVESGIDSVAVVTDVTTVQPHVVDTLIHVTKVGEEDILYTRRVDFQNDDTLIYRGEADIGTLDAEPKWRVRRLLIASDDDVVEEYADGSAAFNKIWDDRASFTYT